MFCFFENIPEKAWENIFKIYDIVFDTIINIAPDDSSFIFTNVLYEGEQGDIELFDKIENLARRKNANFVPKREKLVKSSSVFLYIWLLYISECIYAFQNQCLNILKKRK